jgi:hypothetical protein
MTEGWCGDDYLVLYSDAERQPASERYGIADLLPGFAIIGLRSWDDFIVQDSDGVCELVRRRPSLESIDRRQQDAALMTLKVGGACSCSIFVSSLDKYFQFNRVPRDARLARARGLSHAGSAGTVLIGEGVQNDTV